MFYKRLKKVKKGYKRLQKVTKGYKRLQKIGCVKMAC